MYARISNCFRNIWNVTCVSKEELQCTQKAMYRKISLKVLEFVYAEHTLQFLAADDTILQFECSLSKLGIER